MEFISKQQAIKSEREAGRGDFYDLLGSNPLPDLLRVTPASPEDIVQVRDALAPVSPSGQRTVVDASIDEVQDRKENTDKILSATRVVKLTMGLLAGLLALASLLLVANTIRLSMYARRREVEVMKLVGATDWFIRWPFVIEGVLVGAIGGVTAIMLLGVVKVSLVDPLAEGLRADRRAGDDELRAAHRAAARRRGRRLRARLRPLPAPLPARLEHTFTAPGYGVRGAPSPPLASRRCSSVPLPLAPVAGIWLGGHPENLPGLRARRAGRRLRGPALRGGARHHRRELLPPRRSRRAARRRAHRRRQVARRPLLGLLRPEGLQGVRAGHRGASSRASG